VQAEDRVRRIGQTRPVTSIWISAFEIDHQIDAILKIKSANVQAVLVEEAEGSKKSNMTNSDAPKLSIFQMLKSLFPNQGKGGAPCDNRCLVQSTLPFTQTRIESSAQGDPAHVDHGPRANGPAGMKQSQLQFTQA
jgi:hypothetical protein